MENSAINSKFGVNVVGSVTGEYGLGEGTRSTLRAMQATNIPFKVKKVEVDWHRHLDTTYTDFISEETPYLFNLVHMNPDANLYHSIGTQYFRDRYNIGYWAWELAQIPSSWPEYFYLFDEIWTPSNYAAESLAANSPIPVITIPHSLQLPKPCLNRERLGLPKDKFIFLFIFDFHSTLSRKNPIATIEAFKQAFGQFNQDVLLIIKFSNAEYHPHRQEELKVAAEGWSSIRFIEGHLMKEEVQGLIYNSDCYVSLHRAEGFGLTMAESMYHGKPVIATGFSSNIEFMNVGNSFLVKYDLVTITEDEGSYFKGGVWADPDVDHAASLMRYVFENFEAAKRIGARAAQDIQSLLSPQKIGEKLRSRLEYIQQRITGVECPTRTNQIHKLRAEIDLWASQTQAWKQTARDLQVELKNHKKELQKFHPNHKKLIV